MNFADLTDTVFTFSFWKMDYDESSLWEYEFLARAYDTDNIRQMSLKEMKNLEQNCKRILQAIQEVQGEEL